MSERPTIWSAVMSAAMSTSATDVCGGATSSRPLKIKPYFVVGWTVNLALSMLAGRGVMISYALIDNGVRVKDPATGRMVKENPEGRITIEHLRAFAAAGCEIMLDNGEFSRWKSGRATDGPGFYAFLRRLDAENIPWRWAVAPDVINDAEGTRRRWREAVRDHHDLLPRLVPVFHEGDPWDLLDEYEPETHLVALGRTGGRESKRKTFEWYDEAFNRHPTMHPHALGNGSPDTLEPYWWQQFDVGTWEHGAAFSHAKGWPYNRCTKETRMRAYIEATETMEHRPSKQLSLSLFSEVA
jgi:hypothetical protein